MSSMRRPARLARLGLGLWLLTGSVAFAQDDLLVPPDAELTFFRGIEEPPADWAETSFDDRSWEIGQSGIGYDTGADPIADPLINTRVDDMQNNYVSLYVRIAFQVPDLNDVTIARLGMQYDDGYVAYLNGTEIARVGLTGQPPLYTELAASKDIVATPEWTTIAAENFVRGANVLAIQVHNTAATSSDLSCIPRIEAFSSACPGSLECEVRGTEANDVRLVWVNPINPAPFENVEIERNGVVVGSPSRPTTRVYTDRALPPGQYTYRVIATLEGGARCAEIPTCTVTVGGVPGVSFRRGDADGVGSIDLTDGVFLLNFLFLSGPTPSCLDAADANDDGDLNITTGVFLFNYLFQGGPTPPDPGVASCGADATQDALDCASYDNC